MCPTHSEVKQTEMSEFGAEKVLVRSHARRGMAYARKSPKFPEGFLQKPSEEEGLQGDQLVQKSMVNNEVAG